MKDRQRRGLRKWIARAGAYRLGLRDKHRRGGRIVAEEFLEGRDDGHLDGVTIGRDVWHDVQDRAEFDRFGEGLDGRADPAATCSGANRADGPADTTGGLAEG